MHDELLATEIMGWTADHENLCYRTKDGNFIASTYLYSPSTKPSQALNLLYALQYEGVNWTMGTCEEGVKVVLLDTFATAEGFSSAGIAAAICDAALALIELRRKHERRTSTGHSISTSDSGNGALDDASARVGF